MSNLIPPAKRIAVTEEQVKFLMGVIQDLNDWLSNGIPAGGLVRLWRGFPEEGYDVIDVSGGVTYNLLWAYLKDWMDDVKKEERIELS